MHSTIAIKEKNTAAKSLSNSSVVEKKHDYDVHCRLFIFLKLILQFNQNIGLLI